MMTTEALDDAISLLTAQGDVEKVLYLLETLLKVRCFSPSMLLD